MRKHRIRGGGQVIFGDPDINKDDLNIFSFAAAPIGGSETGEISIILTMKNYKMASQLEQENFKLPYNLTFFCKPDTSGNLEITRWWLHVLVYIGGFKAPDESFNGDNIDNLAKAMNMVNKPSLYGEPVLYIDNSRNSIGVYNFIASKIHNKQEGTIDNAKAHLTGFLSQMVDLFNPTR